MIFSLPTKPTKTSNNNNRLTRAAFDSFDGLSAPRVKSGLSDATVSVWPQKPFVSVPCVDRRVSVTFVVPQHTVVTTAIRTRYFRFTTRLRLAFVRFYTHTHNADMLAVDPQTIYANVIPAAVTGLCKSSGSSHVAPADDGPQRNSPLRLAGGGGSGSLTWTARAAGGICETQRSHSVRVR